MGAVQRLDPEEGLLGSLARKPHVVRRAAHASGRVKTGQGAAMPRSTCSPSGTSGVVVSAATAPEISTDRPSGRHRPSSRLTRLYRRADGGEVQPVGRADI